MWYAIDVMAPQYDGEHKRLYQTPETIHNKTYNATSRQ